MCVTGKTIKLCTCSDKIDKSRPYWTLARKTIKQPQGEPLIGRFLEPEIENGNTLIMLFDSVNTREQTIMWLCNELKQPCFDFNYEPMAEDKLVINLPSDSFEFVYCDNQWQPIELLYPFDSSAKRSVQAKGYVELTE